jgi:hypothetical protein
MKGKDCYLPRDMCFFFILPNLLNSNRLPGNLHRGVNFEFKYSMNIRKNSLLFSGHVYWDQKKLFDEKTEDKNFTTLSL